MPLSNKKHNAAVAAEQQNLAASGAVGGAPGAAANANLPGPAPFTAGPHRHDIMNKLDPTVDSGTGGMQVLTGGSHNNTAAAGFPGQQPVGQMPAGGGVMGSNNPYGAQHNSRMANALDPRVDFAQGQAGGANYYTKGTNVVPGSAAQPRNVPEALMALTARAWPMLRIHESTLTQTAIEPEESAVELVLAELEPEHSQMPDLSSQLAWLDRLPRRQGLIDMTF